MNMKRNAGGFTIVELLVVIVVIAILATLTVLAYTNVQNRSHDSIVATDASAIADSLEVVKADIGRYPISVSEFPSEYKIKKKSYSTTTNNMMYCLNKATDQYGLSMISRSGKGFLVVSGIVREGVPAAHTDACSAVGAAWANDTNNGAIHGYNPSTKLWLSTWPLVQ